MKKSYNKGLKPRIKLWLYSDHSKGSFGDGKWHLLETIEETESLKAACECLGISYRKAWGDLKKAEKCLKFNLVIKSRGGREGGHTLLSERGKSWVRAYRLFRQDIERAIKIAYTKHIKGLV